MAEKNGKANENLPAPLRSGDPAPVPDSEIDALCDRYVDGVTERVKAAVGSTIDTDDPAVKAGVIAMYEELGLRPPTILEVFTSPAELKRETGQSPALVGVGLLHRYAWTLAAQEALGEAYDARVLACFELAFRAFDLVLFERSACLLQYPHTYKHDEQYRLHCEDGPALAWPGDERYYWHGQRIDPEVITSPDTIEARYLLELPAEKRRATYEALGHDRVIRLLGLQPVHKQTLDGLRYELYKARADDDGGDGAWLRMQSPPLQDGSQPYYVEPVHEDCRSCLEALGWRATGELGRAIRVGVQT